MVSRATVARPGPLRIKRRYRVGSILRCTIEDGSGASTATRQRDGYEYREGIKEIMPPGRLRVMVAAFSPLINRADSRLAVAFQGAATRCINSAAFLNLHHQRLHHQRTSRGGSAAATKLEGLFQRRRKVGASSTIARDRVVVARREFSGKVGTGMSMAGGLEAGEACTRSSQEDMEGLSMDNAKEALRSLFGHDEFRDGQVSRNGERCRRWALDSGSACCCCCCLLLLLVVLMTLLV